MSWKNDQVTSGETAKILELARGALGIEGDFVELGCYKGDTSLLLAEILQRDAMLRQKVRCSVGVRQSTPPSATPSSSPSIHAEAFRKSCEKAVEKSVDILAKKLGKNGGNYVEEGISGNNRKRLWIYDSFEGLPDKSEVDESVLGLAFRGGELAVTKREVKERFLRAGLPVPVIKKGWFADLTEADLPERIAFAFLDGDFYESIRDSLRLVVPRMALGGVVVVHDYSNPALPGVRKAVDEWGDLDNRGFRLVCL